MSHSFFTFPFESFLKKSILSSFGILSLDYRQLLLLLENLFFESENI